MTPSVHTIINATSSLLSLSCCCHDHYHHQKWDLRKALAPSVQWPRPHNAFPPSSETTLREVSRRNQQKLSSRKFLPTKSDEIKFKKLSGLFFNALVTYKPIPFLEAHGHISRSNCKKLHYLQLGTDRYAEMGKQGIAGFVDTYIHTSHLKLHKIHIKAHTI